jgi:predicted nuclease with TOPRIM domain
MNAVAPPCNPYPGLRAFEPDESEFFFGRERETDELRRRLRTTRLLAVVGSSGSGKSSLVRSGLIPSLHSGFMSGAGSSWRVAIARPGEDPIGNLAAALDELLGRTDAHADTQRTVIEAGLRDSSLGLAETVRQARLPDGDNVLVVVDQFEELFRFRRSLHQRQAAGDDAAAFVKLLLETTRCPDLPIYVVLTMRSEFIGECMAFGGLPEAVNAGQYLVPRMSREALRAAATGPAAVRGTSIAPRLLARLLNEIGDDLDCLPVLQHALMRTWDAWSRDHAASEPLDMRHYEAIGTMSEALSRHAEEAYAELDGERRRTIAQRLFKAITETTDDQRGIRRPRQFADLTAICDASPAELVAVIDRFRAPGRAFLQPAAGKTLVSESIVDISHESLMRLWARLVGWVREEARSTATYRRLVRSAAQHAVGEASLWRQPELALGLRWMRENRSNAAWAGGSAAYDQAIRFLQRSRNVYRLKLGLTAAGAATVVGLTIAWFVAEAEFERQRSVALQAEVHQLTAAAVSADQARQAQSELVQTLRARNVELKMQVATLQQARSELGAVLMMLREGNRALEAEDERLAAETKQLKERSETLDQAFSQLRNEAADLSKRLNQLRPILATLETQAVALITQVEDLTMRNRLLKRLERETQQCALLDNVPRTGTPALPPAALIMRGGPPSKSMTPPVIPPDPGTSDELRRQIDELTRQLASLQEERARLQDEATWLDRENTLLDRQQQALQQENARLQQERGPLEDRQRALEESVQRAKAERDALAAQVAAKDARNERQLAAVQALRQQHSKLEDSAVSEANRIAAASSEANRLRVDNQRLAGVMTPHVERLLQAARSPQQPSDLAALLAVMAYRWAPYDTDDAAQPAVYNTLWLAFSRLDSAAALAQLAPGDPAGGKLATTHTAILVGELCRRVSRPLTEQEWLMFIPEGACYSPVSVRPCDR